MILLSFAPLIAFHVLTGVQSIQLALEVAAGLALVVIAVDQALSTQGVKILNLGSFVLFAALALYGLVAGPAWNPLWVRLLVNLGLLVIVLATLAARQPFTLQYARQETPPELWATPGFLHVNYVISFVWAAVFAVLVAADVARLFAPGIPRWLDTSVGIAGLVIAFKFTKWYPEQAARRFGRLKRS
jgi:hypothetical protein